jgi:hypothetical protein
LHLIRSCSFHRKRLAWQWSQRRWSGSNIRYRYADNVDWGADDDVLICISFQEGWGMRTFDMAADPTISAKPMLKPYQTVVLFSGGWGRWLPVSPPLLWSTYVYITVQSTQISFGSVLRRLRLVERYLCLILLFWGHGSSHCCSGETVLLTAVLDNTPKPGFLHVLRSPLPPVIILQVIRTHPSCGDGTVGPFEDAVSSGSVSRTPEEKDMNFEHFVTGFGLYTTS